MSTSPAENRESPPPIKRPEGSCLLAVNGGSSSLKFALFSWSSAAPDAGAPQRFATGRFERIGRPDAKMTIAGSTGASDQGQPVSAPDLGAAAGLLIDWLAEQVGTEAIAAVGFRVVHGGPHYHRPQRITPELIAELRRITPLDVDHLPGQIALIECFGERMPASTQVACFDTGFHHDLPRVAQIVPIPRRYEAAGVRRYGFHGLSYAYLMEELTRVAGAEAASGRVILAHLGAGASLAAVNKRRCVDTTMGFTPASGLVMGTRTGDIDPGLPLFMAQSFGQTAAQFHWLVNHESGLLGVSQTSSDLRDLLARRDHDIRAAEAVDLFIYHAKKAIGALAAALSGLDLLVFSGGIGENSSEVRTGICTGLAFLGITLDDELNRAGAPVITTREAPASVRIIRTDEESMIARATATVLAESS